LWRPWLDQSMRADVDLTAWSHGQIMAKLWLVRNLERLYQTKEPLKIAIYGGWYGITAFLILSRDKLPIQNIRSYDIDPSCEIIADKINTAWVYEKWKFKAFTADVNQFNWYTEYDWIPDLVINTSAEHFEEDDWYYSLLPQTCIAVQANNQDNDSHTNRVDTLKDMESRFPMRDVLYNGDRVYEYPDKMYRRFMRIGFK